MAIKLPKIKIPSLPKITMSKITVPKAKLPVLPNPIKKIATAINPIKTVVQVAKKIHIAPPNISPPTKKLQSVKDQPPKAVLSSIISAMTNKPSVIIPPKQIALEQHFPEVLAQSQNTVENFYESSGTVGIVNKMKIFANTIYSKIKNGFQSIANKIIPLMKKIPVLKSLPDNVLFIVAVLMIILPITLIAGMLFFPKVIPLKL